MKKTIALLAIASLFAVANATDDATTWDFSTITEGHSTGVGSYAAIQFTLSGENRMIATPSEEGATLGDLVTLNSITVNVNSTTGDYVMYLTDTSNTLLAVSQVTTLVANSNATFTFDAVTDLTTADSATNMLTLNVGETYYAYFATTGTVGGLTIGNTVAMGQFNSVRVNGIGGFDTASANELGLLKRENNQMVTVDGAYAPLATISVTSATPAVPEPATATLSLLALAGLAARRRRALRAS